MALKKSVRWANVTVYEFAVGIGGSSIPRRGGPAIGLAKSPTRVWSVALDQPSSRVDGADYAESECDEVVEEDNATVSAEQLDHSEKLQCSASTREKSRQRRRRRRRVRWIKPLERVTMLAKAGCSERRIYRTMMECAAIVMSRRLALRGRPDDVQYVDQE